MKNVAEAEVEGLRKIFEKHNVPENARILDLASGIGRISINFAKHGYDIVGVDVSPLYLEYATKWLAKEKLDDRVRFYRMDARDAAQELRKNQEEKFDVILNIGTAMGYYSEKDDQRTFAGLRSLAKPNSLLVIETVNRDCLVKNFAPYGISQLGGIEFHDIRKLYLETSFMENDWKFYKKRRGSLRLVADIPVSHRVYSLHELKDLMERAGWEYTESYGSLHELTPVTVDSFHMTVVGQNPA